MENFFKKLFGKDSQNSKDHSESAVKASTDQDTIPSTTPHASLETKPLSDSDLELPPLQVQNIRNEVPQFEAACGQSVGMQRDHNEDGMFTLSSILICDSTQIPFGLYLVADGMGGHEYGEVASGIAIRAFVSHVLKKLYSPLFSLNGNPPDESLQEIMERGVYEAHKAIIKEVAGGGTTLTAVLLMGGQLTISHVGDSRAYLMHPDGRMQILTRDHSLVKRLEELGQITTAEAAIHPQRNVLYRALGQAEPFAPDIQTIPIPNATHLLLCSDGLWGVVDDREIFNTLTTTPNLQEACQKLINSANQAGGPDNISVIIVQLPG